MRTTADHKSETAAFLEEVKRGKEDSLERMLEEIAGAKYLCVFGAGMTSRSFVSLWQKRVAKRIDFLSDNDSAKWGKAFHGGIVCISPQELKKYKDEAAVIISSRFIQEIYPQLLKEGFRDIYHIGYYRLAAREFLGDKKNIDRISDNTGRLFDVLADERSKEVLARLVRMWFDQGATGLEYASICSDGLYFPGDVIRLREDESFVDAGAYTGDTLAGFLKKTNGAFDSVYAFELDDENFEALERMVRGLDERTAGRIHLYNAGLSDSERAVWFERGTDAGANSRISARLPGMKQAKTVRLSEVLDGKRVSFIKMDIEGAEPDALRGAEELIRKYAPLLAVSVYHEPQHLWEIPFYIRGIDPGYKLYLRHHSMLGFETVCYAVKR